jgi:hypothetical protein
MQTACIIIIHIKKFLASSLDLKSAASIYVMVASQMKIDKLLGVSVM